MAKCGDDLCLGVKGQTNSNSWFSAKSIEVERMYIMIRGRALNGLGWPKAFTNPKETPNAIQTSIYRQTLGAKVQSREGNSPDRTLRSQSNHLVEKAVIEL